MNCSVPRLIMSYPMSRVAFSLAVLALGAILLYPTLMLMRNGGGRSALPIAVRSTAAAHCHASVHPE